jgi:threonine dehydrogenase-like Zn-dependent dehydrogenase
MTALTVRPRQSGSAAVRDVPDPAEAEGDVLVEALAVGICGTDVEIVGGEYGDAPPGEELLVLGHESLGRILEAPPPTGSR